MARFGRVLTAMVTPFTDDGALDFDGAAQLAQWLVDQGNEGLVVAGTTGEGPTLTHTEQADLVATVVAAVDVPVVAGAGSNDTRAAIDLTERCTEAGAAGILHVAGYYNLPSQAGLDSHFRHCAAATDLPVVIYDIPGRTGRKVTTETMVRLAHEVPNIVAVKDAAGRPDETARLLDMAPEGFEVYSGDDSLTLPLLSVGAVGTIGVATHWAGREVAAMFDAFESGRVVAAAAINRRLLDSYAFETADDAPNPVPAKCMLRVLGLPAGPCRLPMGPEPSGLEDRAREVLAALRGSELFDELVESGSESLDGLVGSGSESFDELVGSGSESFDELVGSGSESLDGLVGSGSESLDGLVESGSESLAAPAGPAPAGPG